MLSSPCCGRTEKLGLNHQNCCRLLRSAQPQIEVFTASSLLALCTYRSETFTTTVGIRPKYPSLKYHLICGAPLWFKYILYHHSDQSLYSSESITSFTKSLSKHASPHQQLTDLPQFLLEARQYVMTERSTYNGHFKVTTSLRTDLMLSPSNTRIRTKIGISRDHG